MQEFYPPVGGLAFECMLHAISYAYNKRHTGLTYDCRAAIVPEIFTDASNNPDPKDGKCLGGHICIAAGAAVVWSCKKLRHVGKGGASHTEYMALAGATSDAVWIRNLYADFGLADLVKEPTVVHCDNVNAITWASEFMVTAGNQFIMTDYHFSREQVAEGSIIVTKVATDNIVNQAQIQEELGVSKVVCECV